MGLLLFADCDGLVAAGAGLLDAVRALLSHPTSKSDAAASLHVSRPVFYDRLANGVFEKLAMVLPRASPAKMLG